MRSGPSTLTIAVAYHDAGGAFERVALPVPIRPVRHPARSGPARAATRCYRPGQIATHMHVIASDLRRGPWQLSLFDPPDCEARAMAKVKREINESSAAGRCGRVRRSSRTTWYDDPANEHEVCDIRGKFCF